jgi:hypothetical protein
LGTKPDLSVQMSELLQNWPIGKISSYCCFFCLVVSSFIISTPVPTIYIYGTQLILLDRYLNLFFNKLSGDTNVTRIFYKSSQIFSTETNDDG